MAYSELSQLATRIKLDYPWLADVKYFDKVDSTQKRIEQFLAKSAEGAILVMAETQSKSFGRNNRVWVSPPGGLWFSLALPLQNLTLSQVASFSMVTAVCIADALKEVNDLACDLKWPNDILFKGKKLGGIILTTTTKFKRHWLIIGAGINVNNELPLEMVLATTIKDIRGQSQGRNRLMESILTNIWNAWHEYGHTGFGPYHKTFESRLHGVGEQTKIQAGTKVIEGTMMGVDTHGSLLLKSGENTKTVNAGEIVC